MILREFVEQGHPIESRIFLLVVALAALLGFLGCTGPCSEDLTAMNLRIELGY